MLSLITKGILSKKATTTIIETGRVYYPLRINVSDRKPKITLRPLSKKINIKIQYPEE